MIDYPKQLSGPLSFFWMFPMFLKEPVISFLFIEEETSRCLSWAMDRLFHELYGHTS